MKNIKGFFLALGCLVLFTLPSCQKASINGHLDGRWQILEIDSGGVVENVKNRQLYYNFYLHVCNLSFYNGILTEANLLFKNNQLKLDFPYIHTQEEFERLAEYGIYSNPVEFKVEYLDRKKLILKEGDIIITLRKF